MNLPVNSHADEAGAKNVFKALLRISLGSPGQRRQDHDLCFRRKREHALDHLWNRLGGDGATAGWTGRRTDPGKE